MKNIWIFFLVLTSIVSRAQKFKNGKDLITAMHERYHNKWYKHFTFTQDAFFYQDGKELKKEVWYEAATFPGKLIIKYDSLNSLNGVIFYNNTVTGIKNGEAKSSRPFIHDLLLVGFDVYFTKPETLCHQLDSLGYDLSLIREDEFEGRSVYVVGAKKGNDTIPQFWIDKERLYMHRIVYNKGKNMDVIFSDYVQMEGYWVAKQVIFKSKGQLQMIEKYYDIRFPKNLNESLFDPNQFRTARW